MHRSRAAAPRSGRGSTAGRIEPTGPGPKPKRPPPDAGEETRAPPTRGGDAEHSLAPEGALRAGDALLGGAERHELARCLRPPRAADCDAMDAQSKAISHATTVTACESPPPSVPPFSPRLPCAARCRTYSACIPPGSNL